MYMKPCSCCGKDGHSILEVIEIISPTESKVKFTCPLVRKRYPIIWKRNLKDLVLWPTAKRFAEYHRHQEEVIMRALILFRMYGGGKWMSNMRFLNFKDELKQLCNETQERMRHGLSEEAPYTHDDTTWETEDIGYSYTN